MTRLRTALEADCCRNRVSSWVPIEKLCQLMIEPGELVMVSELPWGTMLTWPRATLGPVGFAWEKLPAKQDATATANTLYCHARLRRRLPVLIHPTPHKSATASHPHVLVQSLTPNPGNQPAFCRCCGPACPSAR